MKGPSAYRNIPRALNQVADDMGRRAYEARDEIVYWNGNIPSDAPANQLEDIYTHFDDKPELDWGTLPPPPNLFPPQDHSLAP